MYDEIRFNKEQNYSAEFVELNTKTGLFRRNAYKANKMRMLNQTEKRHKIVELP